MRRKFRMSLHSSQYVGQRKDCVLRHGRAKQLNEQQHAHVNFQGDHRESRAAMPPGGKLVEAERRIACCRQSRPQDPESCAENDEWHKPAGSNAKHVLTHVLCRHDCETVRRESHVIKTDMPKGRAELGVRSLPLCPLWVHQCRRPIPGLLLQRLA